MTIKTDELSVYMITDKPISGKMFYIDKTGEVICETFSNSLLNVNVTFEKNQIIDNKIEFFIFQHLSGDTSTTSNVSERILQVNSTVNFKISNQPIVITPNNTGSTESSISTFQYFLYIGVPILTLIFIIGIIVTLVYIFKKIKKLKKKKKKKQKKKS